MTALERVLPALRLDLPAVPEAVPGLRRAAREWLDEPCADVQLCVTELVSNVIRHVGEGTPVRVRVARTGARIRVEVTDPDPHTLPVLRRADADAEAEQGRGLSLLDAVVCRWGVDHAGENKTVWCELDGT
ncbi:ATP-binding protein [Streptomyces sp. NPDC051740]|uniref:ATP-binding protein n=1 Tax=Streptomyces sp. NPDC051740 TaxID=3365673 RepID=UPI0037AE9626